MTTDRDTAIAGVDTVAVLVTLRDEQDAPLAGVSVQLLAHSNASTISVPLPTDLAGHTTATWTSAAVGEQSVDLVVDGTILASHAVLFTSSATSLVFTQQPTTSIAGGLIPTFEIAAVDAMGNVVPAMPGEVQVQIENNPSSGTLASGDHAAFALGVASFTQTAVTRAGTGYTLRAHADNVADAISMPFDVLPGDPDAAHSSITAAPGSLEANGVEAAGVRVHLANEYGVEVEGANVALTVSGSSNTLAPTGGLTSATGTMTATLTSTTPETKTVTATVGALQLSTTVRFFGPSCVPQLPGAPSVQLDDFPDSVIEADVDGDGHADVIVGQAFASIAVYRGRGDGTFDAPIKTPLSIGFYEIAVGDVDGDGHLDLVIVRDAAGELVIGHGDGTGQFTLISLDPLPANPFRVALGDYNQDGRLDLAIRLGQGLMVSIGVGDGTFTPGQTFSNLTSMAELQAADVNGDGHLDLLYSGGDGLSTLLGHGDGTFEAPVTSAGPDGAAFVIADFNHDTMPDCAVVTASRMLQIYRGRGDGTFATVNGPLALANTSGQSSLSSNQLGGARDLDHDGNVDLVVAEGSSLTVLSGGGDNTFAIARVYSPETRSAALADFDEDGTVDVLVNGRQTFTVLHGAGGGAFVAPDIHAEPYDSGELLTTTADFDANGQLDLVIQSPLGLGVLLSRPAGTLTDAVRIANSSVPKDVKAGDVTGDGKPDVVALYPNVLTLGTGAGDGSFAAYTSQSIPALTAVQLADLDADGKQDLVMTSDSQTGLWLARSQGTSFAPLQTVSTASTWAATAELTGDGITDVLTSDGGDNLLIYAGDGSGGLVAPTALYPMNGTFGLLRVADVDGDGHADVVMLHQDSTTHAYAISVMRGLGASGLEAPRVTPCPSLSGGLFIFDLAVADMTGDGVPDLLVRSNDYGVTVIPGYGDGYFRQRTTSYEIGFSSGTANFPGFVVSDHDEDGRADVAFWKGLGVGIARNRGCVP